MTAFSLTPNSLVWRGAFAAALAMGAATAAQAQEACAHRGDLDAQFCDANRDLVADTPTDPKRLKDPSTLVFAFTPVEDPAIYEKLFRPFMGHLSQCVGKKVVFFPVQSNAAQIEAIAIGLAVEEIVREGADGKRVVRPAQRGVDLGIGALLQFAVQLQRAWRVGLVEGREILPD